jgi:hypothetical protein
MSKPLNRIRFTWGDSVRVVERHGARIDWRPGAVGSICGMHKVEGREQEEAHGFASGTVVYTVEFEDGESAQIPEDALVPLDEDVSGGIER